VRLPFPTLTAAWEYVASRGPFRSATFELEGANVVVTHIEGLGDGYLDNLIDPMPPSWAFSVYQMAGVADDYVGEYWTAEGAHYFDLSRSPDQAVGMTLDELIGRNDELERVMRDELGIS
jgi:hypothetical protein